MRSRSRAGLILTLTVLGVLCLAAAAIFKWVVLPSQAKLPSDENTTRQYDGTAKLLLNPQAIASGDLKSALLVNTPVTASRNVKTLATSGGTAQVQDSRTLTGANGQPLGATEAKYAVDRKTLMATSDHPSSWQVTPATGITVSWPIGSEKKNYTGWVQETQATTTLKYVRTETKKGLSTYVFQASTQPAPVKDPQVLATLPQALPFTTLEALSAVLPLPPDLKAQLSALPRTTQPVPLRYTYQVASTYWVEPTTGIVVDLQREEIRKAGITVGGQTTAAILPVYDVTTAYTSTSVTDATTKAEDDKSSIDLYGTTLPLILLIVGVVFLVVALLVGLMSRRNAGPARPATTGSEPPPGATTG